MIVTDELEPLTLAASAEAIRTYAELTGDMNPIHIDPVFAATTAMGGIIAHGTMSLSLIWESLARTLGSERVARVSLEARFLAPVRLDDVVTVGGRQRDDAPDVYDVWAKTQGSTVIEGVARIGAIR